MSISITPIEKSLIRVYGIAGAFHVGPDAAESDVIRVRYFNTVASGQDTDAAGNSRKLLEELKPMRERAQVSALRDLSSLLQRELDDRRVAHELVPYLQGAASKVGFFPGILVALVPKGFLEAKEDANYPAGGPPKEEASEIVEHYGECWTLRRLKAADKPISLGRLEIDPAKADLVVLDGQHRANAFRYVTQTFSAASGDTIYSSFYESCRDMGIFSSELPVTILWFEADGTLDPKLLSRQLFVDVNTNAKPVSESRNILLDDRHNASIVVGSLYKILASRGFDTSAFSLLHGGFDCEEGEQHSVALLLPIHFRQALAYFAFGSDTYDGLSVKMKADTWRKQSNYARATRLMAGVTEALFWAARRGDKASVHQLSAALAKDFAPALLLLIEGFSMVQVHVEASAKLEAEIKSGSSIQRETWNKVFCGGEGLYGAFTRISVPTGRAKQYRDTIKEIEERFLFLRAAQFAGIEAGTVRLAYQTFASKAGITGFLMAADRYCDGSDEGWDARVDFIATVSKLPKECWINVFGLYKTKVVGALDPKLWPEIRNIILRVVQSLDPSMEFFRSDQLEDINPDGKFIYNQLLVKYNAFRASLPLLERDHRRPDAATIGAWRDEAISSLKTTLAACGLEPIVSDNAIQIYCLNRIERMLPTEASGDSSNGDLDEEEAEAEADDDEE